jgi:carbonic anhydrase/acetyltransferase-like protein (isoleucine patch superfamily)
MLTVPLQADMDTQVVVLSTVVAASAAVVGSTVVVAAASVAATAVVAADTANYRERCEGNGWRDSSAVFFCGAR